MSRKRAPVAEIGAEDYYIVRHTHDVELAARLMSAKLRVENGCPVFGMPSGCQNVADEAACQHPVNLGKPQLEWVRIVPALPNTYAAGEGWKFTYASAKPHTPGAFPAVVFR